ncbi:MAG: glycine cleavage system protein GcvH [Muribaculaceae bacterium]|nr:glycine cleavage system protein GcvH [Muribaculaceae bacterium]
MIKYLPSHEYVRVEDDNVAYIGISPFAAKQLGNVVYVDMPEEGDEVTKGDEFGAIESVKAASDLFAPVSGEVLEINEDLNDNPKLVSDDPMKNWIIKVSISDSSELDDLLDQAAYDELCAKESH